MNNKKTVNEKLSDALDVKFETTKELSKPTHAKEIEVNAVDSEKDYWLV